MSDTPRSYERLNVALEAAGVYMNDTQYSRAVEAMMLAERGAQEDREKMLVKMAADGVLTASPIWLCPNGKGALAAKAVSEFPWSWHDCPCGQWHQFTGGDIEIVFSVRAARGGGDSGNQT